jgi:hypothetical protein
MYDYGGYLAYIFDPSHIQAINLIGDTIYYLKSTIEFSNNIIKQNFGGFGFGLFDFNGIARILFSNSVFQGNGENIVEIVNYFRKTFAFIPQEIGPNSQLYNSYSIFAY